MRGTNLRLSFGLGVTVEALRTTQATLNGVVLSSGTVVEASHRGQHHRPWRGGNLPA
jgi:hypothetical protein